MTMLLSTFHQSGKARQEKFWLCYPTQPFSVKQYTLWLLLYLFLHFYFSLSSHLSINWAMTLLAALLVSSCTALKLWFLLFFNKASPRPYAHVFITIIAIFFLQMASTAPFTEQVEVTLRTNFQGTLDVCRALFPLLRPHAR